MVSPPVAGLQPQPVANPKPPETMIAPAPVTPTLAPTDSEPEPKEDRLDQPKAPARTAMLEKSQERLPPKERPKPTPVAAKEGMERKREMPSERPAPAADTTDSGMPRQVSREQIQQTMQKHIKAMKLCVEQQVQRDPNVTGTMHVQFTIAPSGGVSEVTIKTAEHSDSFVAGCIAYIIKSMKFPQAREPFIVPDLPLRLGE